MKMITTVLAITCCLSIIACSGDVKYFANKPDPIGTLTGIYGQPYRVEGRADGSEKWVYRVKSPLSSGYYDRFFIIRDGKVIGGGAT
ncbi:MAG TPA: hypothetical protein PK587_13630 [Syntrophales bacterium]|nr:hypothetical protein [Syntrophales bacterium]